ncbi:MAG: M20/M25/M40 family metallo-hydrolase [bacterium]
MRSFFRARHVLLLLVAAAMPLAAQEKINGAAMERIRNEGLGKSQVMDVVSYLTDVYGARLTGSPATKAAGQWAAEWLSKNGAQNVTFETWGPFGRGWTNDRFSANVIAPTHYSIIAYPGAWSVGTNGPVTGDVTMAPLDSESSMAKFKGTLRGKWVMMTPAQDLPANFKAFASRYTDAFLDSLAAPAPAPRANPALQFNNANRVAAQMLAAKRAQFLLDEGAAGVLQDGRGDEGTVFAASTGSRDPNAPPGVPTIIVSAEHYGRMARTIAKGIPVKLEIDAKNTFYDQDLNSFNIIGELPGTDKKDEVVMLGAHFDSWQTGTGATDNAAGSAVMMEAMRILKASGLPMRRTVRIALWTGEEQGLLGSRAYVKEHFGDQSMPTAQQSKVSAYFNVDNGTGAIRGIYQQGNAGVGPIFQQWMEPFADLGMHAQTMRNTTGTDHLSFDAVGIPGFQFIQDPIEYGTRTHHSNQDVYERVQANDMRKNAVIVAAFVYNAANRDALLPRKELPKARPAAF